MTAQMTEQQYINLAVDRVPRATALRTQVAMELRGLIAERVQHGEPLDDVLRQLGDPATFAESYLASVPLVAAGFWRRTAAKLIDAGSYLAFIGPLALAGWWLSPEDWRPIALLVSFLTAGPIFACYVIVAESQTGQTLGKRVMGLRAVRESGGRISVGQSIVRQLPLVFDVFVLDALFALFTDKKQRAFELLSKTRVVRAQDQPA
jgi:uncharacterized RDD family membrane protein YckC